MSHKALLRVGQIGAGLAEKKPKIWNTVCSGFVCFWLRIGWAQGVLQKSRGLLENTSSNHPPRNSLLRAISWKQSPRSSLLEAASLEQPPRSNLLEAISSKQPARSRLLKADAKAPQFNPQSINGHNKSFPPRTSTPGTVHEGSALPIQENLVLGAYRLGEDFDARPTYGRGHK